MVAPTGERYELFAVDVQPSAWDEPIAALDEQPVAEAEPRS
jgi:hypothetical protein